MSTGDQIPNPPTNPPTLDQALALYFRSQMDDLHRHELETRTQFWQDTYKLIRNILILWTIGGAVYLITNAIEAWRCAQ